MTKLHQKCHRPTSTTSFFIKNYINSLQTTYINQLATQSNDIDPQPKWRWSISRISSISHVSAAAVSSSAYLLSACSPCPPTVSPSSPFHRTPSASLLTPGFSSLRAGITISQISTSTRTKNLHYFAFLQMEKSGKKKTPQRID